MATPKTLSGLERKLNSVKSYKTACKIAQNFVDGTDLDIELNWMGRNVYTGNDTVQIIENGKSKFEVTYEKGIVFFN